MSLKEYAGVELVDPVPTAKRQRAVDLTPEEVEHPENAILAGAGDAPEVRAADQHRARAERQRLDDVDAAAKAAVDQDRRPPAGRLDHARQRQDRCDCAVKLAAAVVGDDDSVSAAADRFARVVRVQEALDEERPAPLLAQTVDVTPTNVGIELLVHQRAEGDDRGPFAVIDEGRRRRLRHAHEPARPAQEVEHAARTPPQRKRHAVAGVAVAARHHLIVDGEDERLVTGRRRAGREFRGEATILIEKHLHPFRSRRGCADLLEGRGRGVAGAVDGPEPRRRAGRGEFGVRPQETGEAGRPDDDGRAQFGAEQLDRLVARRRALEQLGRELDRRQRRLVAAHGDLVAGRAVDHVEQHPRQPLSGKRAQRRQAIALALQRGRVHGASGRESTPRSAGSKAVAAARTAKDRARPYESRPKQAKVGENKNAFI